DLLLVGGRLALYAGDGKGRFTDVSQETGLAGLTGHFLGCAVGDVDGDGYPDIYISGYRTALLLLNQGGRRFRDVTRAAGLPPEPWGTSCAFAETVPGSGRLDLYVGDYADFGPKTQPQLCVESGRETSCGPRHYRPIVGHLYRNRGTVDGIPRFQDITRPSDAGTALGKALALPSPTWTAAAGPPWRSPTRRCPPTSSSLSLGARNPATRTSPSSPAPRTTGTGTSTAGWVLTGATTITTGASTSSWRPFRTKRRRSTATREASASGMRRFRPGSGRRPRPSSPSAASSSITTMTDGYTW